MQIPGVFKIFTSSIQGKLWFSLLVLTIITIVGMKLLHLWSIKPAQELMGELSGDVASIEFVLKSEEKSLGRTTKFIGEYLSTQLDLIYSLKTDTLALTVDQTYIDQQKERYRLDQLIVGNVVTKEYIPSSPNIAEKIYQFFQRAQEDESTLTTLHVKGTMLQCIAVSPVFDEHHRVVGVVSAIKSIESNSSIIDKIKSYLHPDAHFAVRSENRILLSDYQLINDIIIQIPFIDLRLDQDVIRYHPVNDRDYILTYRAIADLDENIIAAIVLARPHPFLSLWKTQMFKRGVATVFLILMIIPLAIQGMQRNLSTSLLELKEAIIQVLNNNLKIRARVSDTEVGKIAQGFNVIVDRMNELIEEERENRAELSKLNYAARQISGVMDLETLRHLIMERTIDAMFDVTPHFELFLKDDESGELEASVSGVAPGGISISKEIMEYGEHIANKVVSEATPIIENNIESKLDLKTVGNGRISLLSVPLTTRGTVLGAINIYSNKYKNGFPEKDLNFLSMLAGQVSIALDNAKLYRRVAEQERMGKELEITNEIRKEILPQTAPQVPNLEMSARTQRIRTHGGDYYDYISHETEDKIGLLLADVSARGVQAGIITIIARMAIHASASYIDSPKQMLIHINNVVKENMRENTFIKACYAIWDGPSRTLRFASAGQPHLLLYRGGDVHEKAFSKSGTIGSEENLDDTLAEYEEIFQPNDCFLFFTDGARTARNASNEWFGVAELQFALRDLHDESAEGICNGITERIVEFIKNTRQDDDFTLLVGKVK